MKLTLRLPDDLGERVRAAAAESQRSMNEWMVRAAIFLLREEHGSQDRPEPPDTHQADATPSDPTIYRLERGGSRTPLPPGEEGRVLGGPSDQQTATADGPGHPDFPPSGKRPCTCGPGERAKGKHNKKCPARGT